MDLNINITLGNQTEGLHVDQAVIASMWPDLDPDDWQTVAAVASEMRDIITSQLIVAQFWRGLQPTLSAASTFIDQHTTATH